MWGKFLKFTFRENALIQGIFPHAPPHSNHAPKLFPSRPRQKEIIHSPLQNFFQNLFPPTLESCGRNYDLLCQNSVRKYEDGLEH